MTNQLNISKKERKNSKNYKLLLKLPSNFSLKNSEVMNVKLNQLNYKKKSMPQFQKSKELTNQEENHQFRPQTKMLKPKVKTLVSLKMINHQDKNQMVKKKNYQKMPKRNLKKKKLLLKLNQPNKKPPLKKLPLIDQKSMQLLLKLNQKLLNQLDVQLKDVLNVLQTSLPVINVQKELSQFSYHQPPLNQLNVLQEEKLDVKKETEPGHLIPQPKLLNVFYQEIIHVPLKIQDVQSVKIKILVKPVKMVLSKMLKECVLENVQQMQFVLLVIQQVNIVQLAQLDQFQMLTRNVSNQLPVLLIKFVLNVMLLMHQNVEHVLLDLPSMLPKENVYQLVLMDKKDVKLVIPKSNMNVLLVLILIS